MAAGRPAAFACRQGYPAAAPPLNSRLRATMPPVTLAAAVARQANSAAGGERSPHSQHDAKLAEVAETAARIGLGMMPRPPACTLRKY